MKRKRRGPAFSTREPIRLGAGSARGPDFSALERPTLARDPHAMIWLTLPFPPSTNNLYATVQGRRVKTKAARDYADRCRDRLVAWFAETERIFPAPPLAVTVFAWPPDRRGHDLDNLLKATIDGVFEPLKSAGVNDREIVVINARRLAPSDVPKVVVTIAHTEERAEP